LDFSTQGTTNKLIATMSLFNVLIIDAAQIQNQDSQIPNYFVHPKCTNPKLFVHPKLLMASQITYGIPNYLWHPKLFMASQII